MIKRVYDMGGAGNKSLSVGLARIDAYAKISLGFWDFCGADVIVRAMGCHASDLNGNPLIYDGKGPDAPYLKKGVIVTKNSKVFEKISAHLH
jgi:fructose-1,6-bisphosphatase/inositol monophosphatase family enzyme